MIFRGKVGTISRSNCQEENIRKERNKMSDYMIRATAADSQIRAFAITSKELVEEARKRHNTSPVVTAALGRLMSGAVMMEA